MKNIKIASFRNDDDGTGQGYGSGLAVDFMAVDVFPKFQL